MEYGLERTPVKKLPGLQRNNCPDCGVKPGKLHKPGCDIGLDRKPNCPDCGVKPGKLHKSGCDVEHCALCGNQVITCGCIYRENGMDRARLENEHPDIYFNGATNAMYKVLAKKVAQVGGPVPWTGTWPGAAECMEFGWFCKWVDGPAGRWPLGSWSKCAATDPDATPDLNRLATDGRWDPKARRYFRKIAAGE